jgi:ectoine hydroxylase-related dioxygenase (phytanoyl-CoA dioxygenase family)
MKVIALHDLSLLLGMQRLVGRLFPFGVNIYAQADSRTWHIMVADAQDQLNARKCHHRIIDDNRDAIRDMLQTDDILVQSNLYLRAARPVTGGQESVGWHRESFYGCPHEAMNFWMPLLNVTPENTIQYIPGSETIPDDAIVTVGEADATVERGSAGHKIGLLYAPKHITHGVDLASAKPMPCTIGEAVIFPSSLIHGAAVNRTDRIRFSIDFRLMAKEHLTASKHHFASGTDFFIPLEAA